MGLRCTKDAKVTSSSVSDDGSSAHPSCKIRLAGACGTTAFGAGTDEEEEDAERPYLAAVGNYGMPVPLGMVVSDKIAMANRAEMSNAAVRSNHKKHPSHIQHATLM